MKIKTLKFHNGFAFIASNYQLINLYSTHLNLNEMRLFLRIFTAVDEAALFYVI